MLKKRGISTGSEASAQEARHHVPSQLVWGIHDTHPVCLLPTTIAHDPQWLSPLRLDLIQVKEARHPHRKRGIMFPSQLVWGVHETHPVCLLPTTIAHDPQWLSPLRLDLTQVNLRDLFPRVDRRAHPTPVPLHQELVHQVLSTLRS
jgi:hypothetical protein